MEEEGRKKCFVVNPRGRKTQNSNNYTFSFDCDAVTDQIFSYPSDYRISYTEEYINRQILSMSLWSIIAVNLLEIERSSKVLDMCCAPGMKLVYSGLLLDSANYNNSTKTGSITGIDISRSRLSIAKSLVLKYKVPNVRLVLGDTSCFTSPPIIPASLDKVRNKEGVCRCGGISETPPEKAYYTSTNLRRIGHRHIPQKYDRILVDPECSQTSTVKYMQGDKPPTKDYSRIQINILSHGISLLEENGILIYSTCTFEEEENENVIQQVLEKHPHIVRVPIEESTLAAYGVSTKNIRTERSEKLPFSDSLFIAKLKHSRHIS
ncbi:uncharacterized protein NEPG_01684 [Nematocida parisii ERTm1]|uniref:uncharacterized protein n=1 Tax=Nematocida parisii (strain ERTm1 / ATCC PRA-289) TaxID=881290 RepID=UPI000264B90E|nr:uncharacterized protein NEPG_01684 [Nematocida parisii ERTm1]EIJ93342.1 hypothetical protein NEPG_01684 [Nematocida parisii ERTm1]KAI5145467.1 hypothetical protein NEPAR07_1709 [Nematocida parisii]KAI5156771.1 hypothetical protein NEPAR05_0804 [Nematocida parisii]|eukprot:XP_013059512.1 hypothetical protein NEPG_01684 [Nematocida parisii ERTm1]